MKIVLFSICLFLSLSAKSTVLGVSYFQRINAADFEIDSYFSMGSSSCFSSQVREEFVQNDTLFLRLVFETRFGMNAFGCNRTDTMTQTIVGSDFHYINVSTGVITFDQNDNTLADTIWSMFDSTFNLVAELPDLQGEDFQVAYAQNKLTVKSIHTISAITLVDLNGKQLIKAEGNVLDLSSVQAGVYLLRIFSESGSVGITRWYRE